MIRVTGNPACGRGAGCRAGALTVCERMTSEVTPGLVPFPLLPSVLGDAECPCLVPLAGLFACLILGPCPALSCSRILPRSRRLPCSGEAHAHVTMADLVSTCVFRGRCGLSPPKCCQSEIGFYYRYPPDVFVAPIAPTTLSSPQSWSSERQNQTINGSIEPHRGRPRG